MSSLAPGTVPSLGYYSRTERLPALILSAISLVFILLQLVAPQFFVLVASLVWPAPLSPAGRRPIPLFLDIGLVLMWTVTLTLVIMFTVEWRHMGDPMDWPLCVFGILGVAGPW